MSRNNDIDFVDEGTFKWKLRKLYQVIINEGLKHGIDINDFIFINCQGYNDIIDINYTNNIKDLSISVKGSEKRGYRILNSILDDTLVDEDSE